MTVRKKPLVVITRKLPDQVETRMRELFDARLILMTLSWQKLDPFPCSAAHWESEAPSFNSPRYIDGTVSKRRLVTARQPVGTNGLQGR